MLNTAVILYLGSRVFAAAGTFFAVVLFTRLAGPEEYGRYLLIFSWSSILYGFATHWMLVSYFGAFHPKRMYEYVASLLQLLGLSVAVVAIGFAGMALMGVWEPKFLFAVFIFFVSITVYYEAFEIARVRLQTGAATLSMILRSVLIVAFGTFVLWKGGTATDLTFAVAIAQFIAAIPCWWAFGRIQLSARSREASVHLLRYGWPLMLSMGILASGQSVDRLLLAHFMGAAALGAYGAVADMMRQCFSMVGEAITFSMIPAAKQHLAEGNVEASNRSLKTAFKASVAVAAFGAAFFIVFGNLAVRVLLAPELHVHAEDLIPIFAVAFAVMTVGQYYFVQAMYFTQASFLVPMYTTIMFVVSSIVSVILIPMLGPKGAVIGLLSGYLTSYTCFAVVSRPYYRMPVDIVGFIGISALAALFVLAAWLMAGVISNPVTLLLMEAFVFMCLSVFVVYHYGLLQPISSGVAEKSAELVS